MTYETALRHHLLRCLHKDFEFAKDAVGVGERLIAFSVIDVLCWIDLADDGSARVSTCAGRGVKPSLALLRELNACNGRLRGARVWVDDARDVIVSGDVRTESLVAGELGGLVSAVVDCARLLAPMVAVAFGGPAPTPSSEGIDR